MKRYALVGAGHRSMEMFALPIVKELKDYAELVGIFDPNKHRADFLSKLCGDTPVFDDFEKMLKECNPDAVIVGTIDKYHHEYIIKALEFGCDAISEKPMTIDAEKCREILDAEKRTGKKVIVTFNVRYVPFAARVKELLNTGIIGEPLHINMEWMLDTSHGADYFRRWHRYLENSGGLLVHKSTHHFDMLNWWIEQDPEEVFAFGTTKFYGPTRKERGERCLTCKFSKTCEFYFDFNSPDNKAESYKELYLDSEQQDGYFRDRCVFADDIDIYDTMSVNVKYSGGTLLTYSQIAHSPYEGWKFSISGTKGRIEAELYHSGIKSGNPFSQLRLYNRIGELITYEIPNIQTIHGGGDERLRRGIFVGDVKDTLGQQAGSMAGAMSLLIGAAANVSIAENRPVRIDDLLRK